MDPRMREEMFRKWVQRERMKARARAREEARKKFEEFRKSPIYKTSQLIFTFYDYLTISIGLLFIIGSGIGLYIEHNYEGIKANHIVATVLISFIGLLFILFSISSIQNRNRRSRFFKHQDRMTS